MTLPLRSVSWLLGLGFALVAGASLAVHFVMLWSGHEFIFGIGPALDIRGRRNIVAWVTSIGYAMAAATASSVYLVARRGRGAGPLLWLSVAGLCLALSLAPPSASAPARTWADNAAARVVVVRLCEWAGAVLLCDAAIRALLGACRGRLRIARTTAGSALRADRVFVTCLSITATLLVVSTASAGGQLGIWPGDERIYRFLYVDFEGNLPSWFSAMLLFACALAAALVACAGREARQPRWRTWAVISVGLLALSCDEAASLHELLTTPFRSLLHDAPAFRYPLILPGAAAVAIAASGLWKFYGELPRDSRRSLLSASAVFLVGALGVETAGGWFDPEVHGESLTYVGLATLEEGCEMVGVSGTLHGILRHFERHVGPVTLLLDES